MAWIDAGSAPSHAAASQVRSFGCSCRNSARGERGVVIATKLTDSLRAPCAPQRAKGRLAISDRQENPDKPGLTAGATRSYSVRGLSSSVEAEARISAGGDPGAVRISHNPAGGSRAPPSRLCVFEGNATRGAIGADTPPLCGSASAGGQGSNAASIAAADRTPIVSFDRIRRLVKITSQYRGTGAAIKPSPRVSGGAPRGGLVAKGAGGGPACRISWTRRCASEQKEPPPSCRRRVSLFPQTRQDINLAFEYSSYAMELRLKESRTQFT